MFKELPEGQTHYENDGCGEKDHNQPFHPLAFFAEVVAMTRQERTAVSIEDIAKCFRYQFDEAELDTLITELKIEKHI